MPDYAIHVAHPLGGGAVCLGVVCSGQASAVGVLALRTKKRSTSCRCVLAHVVSLPWYTSGVPKAPSRGAKPSTSAALARRKPRPPMATTTSAQPGESEL